MPSILQLLVGNVAEQDVGLCRGHCTPPSESTVRNVMGVEEYVLSIKKGIDAGLIKLKGDPIVAPAHPFTAALDLVEQTKRNGGISVCENDLLASVVTGGAACWGGRAHSKKFGRVKKGIQRVLVTKFDSIEFSRPTLSRKYERNIIFTFFEQI